MTEPGTRQHGPHRGFPLPKRQTEVWSVVGRKTLLLFSPCVLSEGTAARDSLPRAAVRCSGQIQGKTAAQTLPCAAKNEANSSTCAGYLGEPQSVVLSLSDCPELLARRHKRLPITLPPKRLSSTLTTCYSATQLRQLMEEFLSIVNMQVGRLLGDLAVQLIELHDVTRTQDRGRDQTVVQHEVDRCGA